MEYWKLSADASTSHVGAFKPQLDSTFMWHIDHVPQRYCLIRNSVYSLVYS